MHQWHTTHVAQTLMRSAVEVVNTSNIVDVQCEVAMSSRKSSWKAHYGLANTSKDFVNEHCEKRRSVTNPTIHQRKLWDVKLHIDPPFNVQKAHRQWISGRKDNHCCRWNDHDSKGIISKSNNRHVQKITKVLVRKTTKVLVQKATKTFGNNWMVWCCTG